MSEQPIVTQENFKETPYFDQSWEIVGQPPQELIFTPMEVQVVGNAAVLLDPMFRDYGGRPASDAQRRWHLPAELAAAQSQQADAQEESLTDTRIRIEPEELERLRAEARAEGIEQGRSEELARQQELVGTIGSRFEEIAQTAQRQLEENIEAIERTAVNLALSISKKVIGHAVEINPEYIVPIIRDALKLSKGATIKRVRVSPQDFEFIQVVGFKNEVKGLDGSWQFEADATIESGCLVESSAGEVDYRIDKSWERIKDDVLKVIG